MNGIDIKRPELLALHSCIMIVLNNNIPATMEDVGLLMECMSRIAEQDKITEGKEWITLNLEDKYIKPCWHCCKIVLDNNLQKDHHHATDIIMIFEKIGELANKIDVMGMSPKLVLV